MNLKKTKYLLAFILICTISLKTLATPGEKLVVELKNFTNTELKAGGFSTHSKIKIHIKAQGYSSSDTERMIAYGWILNADTREPVWEMTKSNTTKQGKYRVFNGYIEINPGSYEIYFTCPIFRYSSPFIKIETNIDHRLGDQALDWGIKNHFFFNLLNDWFGEDTRKEFHKIAKNLGLEIYTDENHQLTFFNPPLDFQNILFKATGLGENERVKQAFKITKQIPVTIYCLGEIPREDNYADFGYIIDLKTRMRIWEMKSSELNYAGGAKKNKKFFKEILLYPGTYLLNFYTDDSHSYYDWNDLPPYDPLNYGITFFSTTLENKNHFKLIELETENNIITSITKVGDNEFLNKGISLKKDMNIRVYAIGERYHSRRQMADFGWIINAKTREKIWEMTVDKTIHAGGATKNRMVDEIIHLPKGNYLVYYKTDDSHSYDDWNENPPYDPENYGITLYAIEEMFKKEDVEEFSEAKEQNYIAQIIKVRDNADKSVFFQLNEPTRVRIYALGEGFKNEMFDYGWIEDASNNKVIWEMTYSMTFHAGGARKNRLVNTTLLLDKGNYRLRYKTDDSHSYNNWNDHPPEDELFWGITIYKEE